MGLFLYIEKVVYIYVNVYICMYIYRTYFKETDLIWNKHKAFQTGPFLLLKKQS